MNQARLSGTLAEKKAKRYTPAGLPVIDALMAHQSSVSEAGLQREVIMDIRVKAVGQAAERLEALALGSRISAQGFLAPARQQSRQLIFHLTNFELE